MPAYLLFLVLLLKCTGPYFFGHRFLPPILARLLKQDRLDEFANRVLERGNGRIDRRHGSRLPNEVSVEEIERQCLRDRLLQQRTVTACSASCSIERLLGEQT